MMKAGWKPEQLEQELKKKIIGQDSYLHDLSVCLWLHNQRYEHFLRTGEIISRPKYNMLVIGKSGMGKTSAIEAAAELLNLPLVIEDASELRGSGWKGKNVSAIVKDIYDVADNMKNIEMEEVGFSIVVLDEIDKVFDERTNDSSFSPIGNLLKFMEGMECSYSDGKINDCLQTDNLLFIAIGAFDGLDKIIKNRMKPKTIGFKSMENESVDDKSLLKEVTVKDLTAYGVSEQFLGRLPLITVMNELETSDYENILLNSEISPVRQLNRLMKQEHNAMISISKKAAEKLAWKVKDSALGARSLQGEVINLLKDTLYSLQDDTQHKGYRIDYNDDFFIKAVSGIREPAKGAKKRVAYHLTKEERECIKLVNLDSLWENVDSMRTYVECMFEKFEEKNFGEYGKQGLCDLYDYRTIKGAQLFTTAALTELFFEAKLFGKDKSMGLLLNIIRTISVNDGREIIHPLQEWRNSFFKRIKFTSERDLEEIRGISWEVTKEHALFCYRADFAKYDNDMNCFT